jgi:hypothetical protein
VKCAGVPGRDRAVQQFNWRFARRCDRVVPSGSLAPKTSVDPLGATLGRRFGLGDAQRLDLFPNLVNCNAGQRDLGFMT